MCYRYKQISLTRVNLQNEKEVWKKQPCEMHVTVVAGAEGHGAYFASGCLERMGLTFCCCVYFNSALSMNSL